MSRVVRIAFFGLLIPVAFLLVAGKTLFNAVAAEPPRTPTSASLALQTMLRGLEQAHYEPLGLNDNFSQRVYKLYIERLDPSKRFFTSSDIDQLEVFKNQLDEQLPQGDLSFGLKASQLFSARIEDAQRFSNEILAKPFDFNVNESVILDGEKTTHPKSAAEMKETWRKYLKYQTLQRFVELSDRQDTILAKKDSVITPKSMAQLEEAARQKVKKSNDELFKNLKEFDEMDRLNMLLSAVANAYDPHTDYLAPKDKANFDIQLTGSFEGIGATLARRDGRIRVEALTPGGPAAKQGDLKPSDVLLQIAQGKGPSVDITEMEVDDAVQLIRGKKGTVATLTVQKPDGSQKVISITRDVVVIEETYAQGGMLDGKVGYIRLPVFYDDFNKTGSGRSSAEDVKKEIAKLKAAGAKGMVLDLRDNGGGSLNDAVKLAGLFISEGPIVQVKSAEGRIQPLPDVDSRVQWDGPLVVLINEFSASASEIVAAAIQDYKRGIIMGSKQSFGKGTVQQFADLDDFVRSNDDLKPLGNVKLTLQKFYRISGGTTQLKGVSSDIVLPDIYDYVPLGERDENYPLAYDEIPKASYAVWTGAMPNLSKSRSEVQKRTASSDVYTLIRQEAERQRDQFKRVSYSLKLSDYKNEMKQNSERSARFKQLEKLATPIKLTYPGTEMSEKNKDRLEDLAKRLERDPYLAEAVSVVVSR